MKFHSSFLQVLLIVLCEPDLSIGLYAQCFDYEFSQIFLSSKLNRIDAINAEVWAEDSITFILYDPNDFIRLEFDKAPVNASLGEGANIQLKFFTERDSKLKLAVLLNALEHKVPINPYR